MKKYLLAAALVMISTSAMADRVMTAPGSAQTKSQACAAAKNWAESRARENGEQVVKFSACDCEEITDRWDCHTDARLEKKEN